VVSGEYLFIVAVIFYPNLMASRIGGFRRLLWRRSTYHYERRTASMLMLWVRRLIVVMSFEQSVVEAYSQARRIVKTLRFPSVHMQISNLRSVRRCMAG